MEIFNSVEIRMTVETIGLITTNAVILIGAVWKLSGMMATIRTQLAQVIRDHKEDTDAMTARLNAHEARLLNIEQARRRLN